MKQKNASGHALSESCLSSKDFSCNQAEDPPEKDSADSLPIDFRTPEFNVTDDLDDNIGNYRKFETLDGIVTADMLHQKERSKRRYSASEIGYSEPVDKKLQQTNTSPADIESAPLPLTIVSKGRVLLVGTAGDCLLYCAEHLADSGLSCVSCLVTNLHGNSSLPQAGGEQPVVQADTVVVTGSFGGFTAMASNGIGQMSPLRKPGENSSSFDLVLDLQPVPSYAGKLLPMGYYAPGEDKAQLDTALQELLEMKGRFTKPRFTVFLENRCLHGRSRSNQCQRCLEICPVSAIRSEHNRIVIDSHLCQGCGSCALVCPAHAISMYSPTQQELLARMQNLMAQHGAGEDSPPVMVIHDADIINPETLLNLIDNSGHSPILFAIEEIGRVGVEIMLAALACGSVYVIVLCSGNTPADTIAALEQQRQIGDAVLQGLQMQEDRIRILVWPPATDDSDNVFLLLAVPGTHSLSSAKQPFFLSTGNDKPALMRSAVCHLHDASDTTAAWIALPAGAPFGTVTLDKTSCTLCMACAGVCPTGALTAGGDVPRLSFTESECHQCGLCREACPEDALQLQPRILCTGDRQDSPTVLQEAEPFTCIECGEPFASPAMIKSLQEKLAGHWMYKSKRQMNRLRMCRSCRTRDALLARDF